MSPAISVTSRLSPATRQELGIKAVAHTIPISHLANQYPVSRKFVYQQGDKAQQSLDESFASSQGDDVLFHLPITKNWLPLLYQVAEARTSWQKSQATADR